jgi:hypothetical protein
LHFFLLVLGLQLLVAKNVRIRHDYLAVCQYLLPVLTLKCFCTYWGLWSD